MVSVFPTSAVNRGFEPRSSQTKDYAIVLCSISTRQTTLSLLRSESEQCVRVKLHIISFSRHDIAEINAHFGV